jgi:F-type H+-transporting ATPase subunit b
MNEARAERDTMLKEAREVKESILVEAKTKATQETERILKSAREQINNEKNAAIAELKNQVATLSIDIAEKILKSDLSSDEKQRTLVSNLMKDVNLN